MLHCAQELVLALVCEGGCHLLNEIHLCVLRTLAGNESPRDRKRRRLPLETLDEVCLCMFYVCMCVCVCACVCVHVCMCVCVCVLPK